LPSTNNETALGAKINFLGVFYAKNVDGIESDGLVGLSPLPPNSADGKLSGHLLISQLKV